MLLGNVFCFCSCCFVVIVAVVVEKVTLVYWTCTVLTCKPGGRYCGRVRAVLLHAILHDRGQSGVINPLCLLILRKLIVDKK